MVLKSLSVFILSALIIPCCQAQVELLGKGVAKDITYYDNGQPKHEGYYKYGNKYGKWIEWHENGQRMSVKYFDENGNHTGKWTFFYETGRKKYTIVYKDGKIDGKWMWWYENGNKWHEITYKDGEVVGKWVFWHKDGKLNEKGIFAENINTNG